MTPNRTCARDAADRVTTQRDRPGWGILAVVSTTGGRGPGIPDGDARVSTDALLVLVAGGDNAAFAQVYDALSPGVFGTCLAVLRDRDHAAEVTQEVMVEVWRSAARFDPELGSARAWVVTLAHRRSVDRVRSVQAQRNRDQRVLDEQGERPFDVVAEEVEGNLDRDRVRQCLDGLTATQHRAVTLAYYGGRTYREVAEELSAPPATVKSRIRDGLIRLRDCLGVAT